MNDQLTPDVLDALVCELGKRPTGAPTIEASLDSVTEIRREKDALIVTFESSAADTVRAVVEAERACCSTIGWQLETDRDVQLRIKGGPVQLDTLEAIFGRQPAS